ncbi:MAG: N-acetylmuramoyl-L-alanine amidase [Bacteroidota bacterium]
MYSTRSFLLILALIFCANLNGQSRKHLEVTAKKGEGMLAILRTYEVNTACNQKYFRSVNGMRPRQGLVLGKSYKLPIYLYVYNGKSIRSTTGVNDLAWAESIQKYNELMHQAGIKRGDYRQDRELWVPYSKMNCRSEELPILSSGISEARPSLPSGPSAGATNNTRPGKVRLRGTYPIFGKDEERVPLYSTRLRGKVYYIVGGHGGPDPGAVGTFYGKNLCEDEYAYDISLRLAWNLLSHGATVYLIIRDEDDGIRTGEILPCDKDETCWVDKEIPASQKLRLAQRSDAINMLYKKNKRQGVNYQRLVVLHVDSKNQGEKTDVYFYHKIGDNRSKKLAVQLQETMRQKYDEYRKDRGYSGSVTSRDLHMLRETDPTAVFIELGNIRNRNDQARLVIEGNRRLLANWLFDGLLLDAR